MFVVNEGTALRGLGELRRVSPPGDFTQPEIPAGEDAFRVEPQGLAKIGQGQVQVATKAVDNPTVGVSQCVPRIELQGPGQILQCLVQRTAVSVGSSPLEIGTRHHGAMFNRSRQVSHGLPEEPCVRQRDAAIQVSGSLTIVRSNHDIPHSEKQPPLVI